MTNFDININYNYNINNKYNYVIFYLKLYQINIIFIFVGFFHLVDVFFSDFKERDDCSEKKTPEEISFFLDKLEPIFFFSLIW